MQKPRRPDEIRRSTNLAAVRWYEAGFAAGAGGAGVMSRKGRPRLRAMWPAWREGLGDGAFARKMFAGAWASTRGRKDHK